jgi:hypothetical protein
VVLKVIFEEKDKRGPSKNSEKSTKAIGNTLDNLQIWSLDF